MKYRVSIQDMFKLLFKISIFTLVSLPLMAAADNLVWKFNIISAMPIRTDTPADFCTQFSPDNFTGALSLLQQSGTLAQNGMQIKFRSVRVDSENGLVFTKISAQISRKLNPYRTWYTSWFIHLQQLTRSGVADGVWSTPDCKGRLIAQPVQP